MRATFTSTLRHVIVCTVALLTTNMFCSCDGQDDNGNFPPVQTDLACLEVSSDGIVNIMELDDGTRMGLANKLKSEKAGVTLRCLCMYAVEQDMVRVYSARTVFDDAPKQRDSVKVTDTDPVKFISAWRAPKYLNINIGVMTTGAAVHKFEFALDSIGLKADGSRRTAYFTLMHKQPANDPESYTADEFICLPLNNFADCDSVAITINTYDGPKTIIR